MNHQPLRGVNFGGWLLLEKWMTPSVFAGTDARDEYSFMMSNEATQKIKYHRDTFITEADFIWLHANGITAIRIPVGYWILTGEAPYLSATTYLDWAMAMGQKYSMQVIIDLHGLKGSQNGRDHSGKVGVTDWVKHVENRHETLITLAAIAYRYRDYENFWGLEIINEPKLKLLNRTLRSYYHDAYDVLKPILRSHTRIIYSDAFTPRLMSRTLRGATHPVVMDVHLYHQATIAAPLMTVPVYLRKVLQRQHTLLRLAQHQPIIIGEWSGVMHHTTMKRLAEDQHRALFEQYVTLQLELYNNFTGWFYWSYKTEAPGQWNFRSQVDAGLIKLNMIRGDLST